MNGDGGVDDEASKGIRSQGGRGNHQTCGMLFCDLRTEVTSGPSRDDSMSQRKALSENPVRCGACSVGDLYLTAAMSTSSTGGMARGPDPDPLPVEFDPPMPMPL